MELKQTKTFNNNYITFTYTNRKVRGYILNYDIKNHTIMLNLDYNSQQSNPTHKSDELFNIDILSDCILEYSIHDYIRHDKEVKADNYYYPNDTSANTKTKISTDDNIDFIDDDIDDNTKLRNNNKYPRYTKPKNIIINHKQKYNNIRNNDNIYIYILLIRYYPKILTNCGNGI